ncbi:MAG: hypothetical protein KF864_11045 [Phycisphaeraceae bacterium]|nr:hypothetical protein [Phycisphaeraceae bacterium]
MKTTDATSKKASPVHHVPARTVAALVTTCALTLGITMLIWMKLRVVTTIPRTAYAEPERQIRGKAAPPPAMQAAAEGGADGDDRSVPGEPRDGGE